MKEEIGVSSYRFIGTVGELRELVKLRMECVKK